MSETILKTHLALNTARFDQAVAFYRAFFGAEPVKHKPGYAKFDIANPPLNLTLNLIQDGTGEVVPGALNHLGVQVASTADVEAAIERLAAAGLDLREERGTDCCYALQDKVWVSDPDGNRWEVFVVKVADTRPELTAAGATATASCCGTGAAAAAEPCCAPGSACCAA
jgi:catechol 2,3-dioxygenase-like lactoylglutathione lyase family enzyme